MLGLLLSTTRQTATHRRAIQRAIPILNPTTPLFLRSQLFPPAVAATIFFNSMHSSSLFSSENISSNHQKSTCNASDDVAFSSKLLAEKNSEAEIPMKFAETTKNLLACYDNGEGVAMNKTKSFEWFSKSAEEGDADAMYNLGVCYYSGEGTDMNSTKAFKWLSKSAEKGNAEAICLLGRCYVKGCTGRFQRFKEIPKVRILGMNETKAFEFEQWSKSAGQGDSKSAGQFEKLLFAGQGPLYVCCLTAIVITFRIW